MSEALDTAWRPSKAAIANTVGDEVVILHLENSTYYGLDPVGALIWAGLQDGKSTQAICNTILSTFDTDHETAAQDLAHFLYTLEQNELVERK